VPRHVEIEIAEYTARYGKLKLTRDHRGLVLSISAAVLAEELVRHQTVALLLGQRIESQEFFVEPAERGRLKQALIRVGYPVEDLAGYRQGDPLEIILRRETRGGLSFHLRDYQREAAETFYAAGTARGGSGVIVKSDTAPSVPPHGTAFGVVHCAVTVRRWCSRRLTLNGEMPANAEDGFPDWRNSAP